jgi:hypothetical protein
VVGVRSGDIYRTPRIRIDDESTFIALKIAEAGFYGGDPQRVLDAPVDMILNILRFREFQADYDKMFQAMNEE